MTGLPPIGRPTAAQVAARLRSRVEAGSTLTDEILDQEIDAAYAVIVAQLGPVTPTVAPVLAEAVALDAAIRIEYSYYPEQAVGDDTLLPYLRAERDRLFARLTTILPVVSTPWIA